MANRSYLYSSSHIPNPDVEKQDRSIMGISEWAYDIPLIYKILLSGNPQVCHSCIWDEDDPIALVGEYAEGVKQLKNFLNRIHAPVAQPLIKEAIEFLETSSNQQEYFLLECGEIFDMQDEPLAEQNSQLLHQIKNINEEIEKTLQVLQAFSVQEPKPLGFFAKLFGRKNADSSQQAQNLEAKKAGELEQLEALGLGAWSNVLYYQPK